MENVLRSNTAPSPSPVATRRPNHDVRVGLFVILGTVTTLVILFTGTNPSTLRGRHQLTTQVPDAGGLRKGDAVRMRGVTVGSVRGFQMVPSGVEVQFDLGHDWQVPADSHALITSSGLLGGAALELVPGQSSESLRDGQAIPGSAAAGPLDTIGKVADETSQTLGRVQALLSDQTVQSVQTSSAELARVLEQLSSLVGEQRQSMTAITGSLRRSAKGVERVAAGPELARVITRLDSLSARLDQASGSLAQSAASAQTILGRVAQGQGMIGKLSRDEALYDNLNQAVGSINQAAAEMGALAQDFRQHPKRYVNFSLF
jgi:phospholipid/cholesterol/gamma-HCH transport system substrate-binding protein